MGSIKVRNLLFNQSLKQSVTRILVIDDHQIRFNQILNIFKNQNHAIHAIQIDDLTTFEKQLNSPWDLIIFAHSDDCTFDQVISTMKDKQTVNTPLFVLEHHEQSEDLYKNYIAQGVYEILNLEYPERFYISIMRGLNYYRALEYQNILENDLLKAQLEKIEIAEKENKAIAILQEGIHIEVNQAYLNLFGLEDDSSIIGLPLLDILQPVNLNDFKKHFKRVSKGDFDSNQFEIESKNINIRALGPLIIEFYPSTEEDSLQIIVDFKQASTVIENSLDLIDEVNTRHNNSFQNVLDKMNLFLDHHPAKFNALVVFSLSSCPDSILTADWKIFKTYFEKLSDLIREQVNHTVFRIEIALYATIIQADTLEVLKSRLYGLQALEKPQLVTISNQNFPQHVKLGYHIFDGNMFDDNKFDDNKFDDDKFNIDSFEQIITLAYNNRLITHSVSNSSEHSLMNDDVIQGLESLNIDEDSETTAFEIDLVPNHHPDDALLLSELQQALDLNQIQLKYQQIYDKEDTSLNTYEVSCGFVYKDQWISITDLTELDQNPELSIKIDRWILVESSKQLHNFITQYPEAKLIINLNYHILLAPPHLIGLLEKLISIIGSKATKPIILQFDEENFVQHLSITSQSIQLLKNKGVDVAIRNFGSASASQTILHKTNINLFTLDETFTEMLNFEQGLNQLQKQIQEYNAVRPLQILLKGLHDMDSFANAWNVDVRFLQGDYFQKKLDHLTDIQDQ